MSETSARTGSVDVERLIFFSDAVVAIAITLLALELPVPTGDTAHEFWSSARHNDGHYLSFLISFGVIAISWSQHHRVFSYAERSDSRLRTLNMCWLLAIIVTPFATKLLTTENHDNLQAHALRFGFYALVEVLSTTAFLAMVHHMVSHQLQAPDTDPQLRSDADWHSFGIIVGFGLSIPLFFATTSGWVLWAVVPVLTGQVQRAKKRRSARTPG